MKINHRSKLLAASFSMLVLVSLACGSASPTSEPAKISTATIEAAAIQPGSDTPVAPIQDTPTQVTENYLGDTVQAHGYAMAALTVADPAKPGMLYQSETGKKLIAVEVVISNVSGDMLGVNIMNATLLDNEGFVYQNDLGSVDNQVGTVDLNPGEQVRGWISFKIPEASTAASLKYSPETFGNYFLQASLATPPSGHQPAVLTMTPVLPTSKLGDVVEQFGYSLTANTLEDPAKPGILYSAQKGFRLVAVEITLTNVSGSKTLSANPLYAYLVDSKGFIYGAELGGRDGQINSLDLSTGEKTKGWVSFMIPDDATPSYIKYQTDVFSTNYLIAGVK
jgi:hypothetical protein